MKLPVQVVDDDGAQLNFEALQALLSQYTLAAAHVLGNGTLGDHYGNKTFAASGGGGTYTLTWSGSPLLPVVSMTIENATNGYVPIITARSAGSITWVTPLSTNPQGAAVACDTHIHLIGK